MKTTFHFSLCLSLIFFSNIVYSNDCASAEIVGSIPYAFTGTTTGAGDNYDSSDACESVYMTSEDFVFTYNSPGNEVLGVQLDNLNDDFHGLFIMDGCPDDPGTTCLYSGTKNNTDSVFIETVYFELPDQYFIVVSSRAGFTSSFDFELNISNTVGNICENALQIPSVPFSYTGTTEGSGNDYGADDACTNAYMTQRDFIFAYNSPGDEVLGIQLDNLNDDFHGLFIMDGCPDDPATTCLYSDIKSNTDSIFIETVHLQLPGEYFVVVSSRNGFTNVFDFQLTVTTPVGNICENAMIIPSVPFLYSGTTVGSGDDYSSTDVCANTYMSGRDFIFEYNSPGNEVLGMQLDNLNDDFHGLFVLDGCPDDISSTCLYTGISGSPDSVFIETVHLIDPGQYYFVVSSRGDFTINYDFELSITKPIGNICENARPISTLPFSFTGTTRGTGNDYGSNDACSNIFLTGRDHVFEYTPLGDEYLDFTLTNIGDDFHGLFIVEGCPNDPLATCYAFDTEANGFVPITLSTFACLTAGVTYYIVVSSRGSFTQLYDFTLDIEQNLQVAINATETSGLTNDNTLCENEAGSAIVNLVTNVTGGNGGDYSFMWDNSAASSTSDITETPLVTSTYTVTATDNGGCSVVESVQIVVDPELVSSITSMENSGIMDDNIICADQAGSSLYTLDASMSMGGVGSYTYAWNNGENTASINESPAVTTAYSVTVTDGHQCTESSNQQVLINPALSVTISATENSGAQNDLVICESDADSSTATLQANPSGGTSGYTYSWDTFNPPNPSFTFTPSATATYTVTITDSNGCEAVDDETIEVVSASCVWTGPTIGNWYDNSSFWSLGRFPTVCDHVVIPANKIVTLRNGFQGWGNTLDVQGQLETQLGAELDIVTEH